MVVSRFVNLHDVWLWGYSAAKYDDLYLFFAHIAVLHHWIHRKYFHNTIAMAEGETSSVILPYHLDKYVLQTIVTRIAAVVNLKPALRNRLVLPND